MSTAKHRRLAVFAAGLLLGAVVATPQIRGRGRHLTGAAAAGGRHRHGQAGQRKEGDEKAEEVGRSDFATATGARMISSIERRIPRRYCRDACARPRRPCGCRQFDRLMPAASSAATTTRRIGTRRRSPPIRTTRAPGPITACGTPSRATCSRREDHLEKVGDLRHTSCQEYVDLKGVMEGTVTY